MLCKTTAWRRRRQAAAFLIAGVIVLVVGGQVRADPVHWPVAGGGNGHYYEYVLDVLSWEDARVAAEGRQFMGDTGHLVTITSQGEQDFIFDNVTEAFANAGASDTETEGVWKWVVGPETGTVFWQQGVGTITYADWWSQGANDGGPGGSEDYLMLNYFGSWNPKPGSGWNDYFGNAGYGYVVEFSNPIPEPGCTALLLCGALTLLGLAWRKKFASQTE